MNVRARALVALLALASFLPAGPLSLGTARTALAQQPEDPAVTAEARKRFLEGVKLFDEKKYELARVAFVQAYAIKKHPDVLLNLAQTEVLAGKPLDAVYHFKEFLKDPSNASHPKRPDAERGLAEARAKTGRLQITVDAPDAEVLVDGKKIGTSPLAEPVDVAVGQHSVEARKEGKTSTQTVFAAEGKVTISSLSFSATNAPPVVAPPPGTGEPRPAQPDQPKPDKPEPKPDQPPPEEKPAEPSGGREPFIRWFKSSPLAYVGAGVTGVGVGVAVGFGIAGQIAKDNAAAQADRIKQAVAIDPNIKNVNGIDRSGNPCASPVVNTKGKPNGNDYAVACTNLSDNLDAQDFDRTMMTVGIITAVVGAGVVVGGYFLTAKRGDEAALKAPRFMLTPTFTPGIHGLQQGGFSATGSF